MPKSRIAIISTPRSGNTWVNYCLSDILGYPTVGIHRYSDIQASLVLPNRLILQIHWQHEDKVFQNFLTKNHFFKLTIARHPLDVLISILRFTQVQTSPLLWLDNKISVLDLPGVDPSQQKFIDWCLSDNATKILEISYMWAMSGDAYLLRYEDMIEDPVKRMQEILNKVGAKTSDKTIKTTIDKFSPEFFRQKQQHSWRATKDNWHEFFTKSDAKKIFQKHKHIFEYFNYDISGAVNRSRLSNLGKWDVVTSRVSPEAYLYRAITDIDSQAKHLQFENINKDQKIELYQRHVDEQQSEISRIGARIKELENLASLTLKGVGLKTRLKRAAYGLTTDWVRYVRNSKKDNNNPNS